MGAKVYRFYCDYCNWKKITDGTDVKDTMNEYLTSPIPGGAPKLDEKTKKVITSKSIPQPRRFKCPQCGRLVFPKKITNPQEEMRLKQEALEREAAAEKERLSVMEEMKERAEKALEAENKAAKERTTWLSE